MKRCVAEGCEEKGTISQVTLLEQEDGLGERWYCKRCYDKLGNTYNENLLWEHDEKRII